MQTISDEMFEEGYDFNVVIINIKNEENLITSLTDTCSFPVFQDLETVNAWTLYNGVKDDIFVYTADHLLHSYLSPFGNTVTVLSSEAGKENMRNAIIGAHSGL